MALVGDLSCCCFETAWWAGAFGLGIVLHHSISTLCLIDSSILLLSGRLGWWYGQALVPLLVSQRKEVRDRGICSWTCKLCLWLLASIALFTSDHQGDSWANSESPRPQILLRCLCCTRSCLRSWQDSVTQWAPPSVLIIRRACCTATSPSPLHYSLTNLSLSQLTLGLSLSVISQIKIQFSLPTKAFTGCDELIKIHVHFLFLETCACH